jgi:glycine cleavage system H protein
LVEVGEYEVKEGLYYSENDLWASVEDGKVRVGITDYAQKQLKEIVFLELPGVGSEIEQGESFGAVESVKAVSDLVAPVSGTIIEQNEEVEGTPEKLNEDPYGEGWLILMEPSNLEAELKNIMDFDAAVKRHEELVKEG